MLLLERDQQLLALSRWHDATQVNGGCIVLVTGEAGIGKTSLVREFARRSPTPIRLLWGACDPLSTPQPLGPLRDVSRQVGGALSEALKGTSRERIFTTVLDELERAGDRVVLVIEDMHWADDASLDLLKYLGRRIARTRAMLIATYRNDEVDARHPLQTAIGHLPGEAVKRLALPPLSETAVSELAQTLGRVSSGLHAATTGNPFYVTEVLAAAAGELPASVRDAVLSRIARLSTGARKVAELAALVPGRTEPWLIREVLHAEESAIEECKLSGMTRDQDGSLSFRHELSRRAVEDSLPPAQARALHQQILSVIKNGERRSVSESCFVHHALGAGDGDAVLEFAPLAADRSAAVGAHREAIAFYRAALQYEERLESSQRACMLDGLAYECYLTGQIDEAVAVRMRSLALSRANGNVLRAGNALRWLSRLNWFRGRGEDADGFAAQAVAVLEPLGPSNELAMAYSNLAQLAMLAAHRSVAIEWGERAIQLAQQLGNQEVVAHALNNVGTARMEEVGDAGWRELEESLQISLRNGFQEHVGRAYTNMFSCSLTHRDYVAANINCEAGIAYCNEHELDAWGLYIRAFRARASFEQAAWGEALRDAEDLLSRPGLPATHRMPALAVLGRVRTRRGDEGAEAPFDEALALAAGMNEPQRASVVAAGRAELAWLRGDNEAAAREARNGLDVVMRSPNVWMHGELIFWLWKAGALGGWKGEVAEPYRLQMDGDCVGAANVWASRGCRYEEAMALADSRDEAHRRRALEIFEALDARPMARIVRKQLQADGVRGLKRGANRATRANPAGLTTRELQILSLLADNLSNAAIARRLFLSSKTVGHHASAILSKLGIESRREAADAARRHGIDLGERRKVMARPHAR